MRPVLRLRRPTGLAGLALLVLGASQLIGCRLLGDDQGLFVDPRDDYLAAKTGKPLVVPDGLAGVGVTDPWPIPDIVDQPVENVYPEIGRAHV